jgi:hypothetical protein
MDDDQACAGTRSAPLVSAGIVERQRSRLKSTRLMPRTTPSSLGQRAVGARIAAGSGRPDSDGAYDRTSSRAGARRTSIRRLLDARRSSRRRVREMLLVRRWCPRHGPTRYGPHRWVSTGGSTAVDGATISSRSHQRPSRRTSGAGDRPPSLCRRGSRRSARPRSRDAADRRIGGGFRIRPRPVASALRRRASHAGASPGPE